MLSRLAGELAEAIKDQDWSDAPYRFDRAGHNRARDSRAKLATQLDAEQTQTVQANVALVVAEVLSNADPNFDRVEFARACGVTRYSDDGLRAGAAIEP